MKNNQYNITKRRMLWSAILVFGALCLGMIQNSKGAGSADRRIPVILDTDIGDDIDDTWALAMLLNSPEFDIQLVVGDQGRAEYRAKLIAKLLEVAGRTDIPVGVGLDVNRSGDGPQSAWVKDYDLKAYPGKVYRDGVQAMIDTIMKSERPVTLIAIGPLPNVAAALEREPDIARRSRFVGMHGSVRVGYGGSKTVNAEYNVRADAKACQKVFSAGWDITITPLDTCGLIHLTGEQYRKVRDSKDPLAAAVMENYRIWSAENARSGRDNVSDARSSTLFDTVAVYLAYADELVKMENLHIRVNDDGYTVIDPEAKVMNVATAWKDMGAFESLLADRVIASKPCGICCAGACGGDPNLRCLSLKDYREKMKAGWIGQMVGVGWGGPTEFKWKGAIIPEDKIPQWKPEMVNQFQQDDIYVEMTFMRTLELHGLEASIRQAGIDFANSGYRLWHANRAGRDNLRQGIAPPDSGHPRFNKHADDIDYQIEADFSGLIAPGLPNLVIELGEKFGRLMNYGDGVYGGQFVGGMYAEAFFETDIVKIVRAGLECIPKGSQFYECIADVLSWYEKYPSDWAKTWQLIEDKYQDNTAYRLASCDKGDFNIDAKINGAYIAMGLLYGQGDLDQTIVISTRCGQDSDCNPSNAGGVLFTTLGFSQLPDRFVSALDPNGKFSHTPYNFPKLIEVSEQLVRQAVKQAGGEIEKSESGDEVLIIPRQTPRPSRLEQCWEAGLISNSRFTESEVARITAKEQ